MKAAVQVKQLFPKAPFFSGEACDPQKSCSLVTGKFQCMFCIYLLGKCML